MVSSSHKVQLLLAHGADANLSNGSSFPLHSAAHSERLTRMLLAAGANVNVTDAWGNSALHVTAADNLSLRTLEDANVVDAQAAANYRNPHERAEAAKALLEAGADVEECTADGTTPFLMTRRSKCIACDPIAEVMFRHQESQLPNYD
jgi:ankyrin repeat protein